MSRAAAGGDGESAYKPTSLAHGSNDGQKGMGLILLVLIGFLPAHYALNTNRPVQVAAIAAALPQARAFLAGHVPELQSLGDDLDFLKSELRGKASFSDVPLDQRWAVRGAIFRTDQALTMAGAPEALRRPFVDAIEFVPLSVKIAVAVVLAAGTTVGYKRIVITVAERIGKTHLTYAQGAAAELVAAATIMLADVAHAPVSTTHVLSSGVAGTMVANGSGIQRQTLIKIGAAWVLTLPGSMLLAGGVFAVARWAMA
jgi:PiT family inorganic phosphate transporter